MKTLFLLVSAASKTLLHANGECLNEGSITEGAWSVLGVNGTSDLVDENNVGLPDPTWTIPDGYWSYPQGEMGDWGANYFTQYTCSKLQFCNPVTGSYSVPAATNTSNDVEEDEDAVWGCYMGGKCGEGGHGCCDCSFATEEECADSGKDWELKPIWSDGCGPICTRRRLERFHRRKLNVDPESEQAIYKLASKELFEKCDFTDATLVGTTSSSTCVEIEVDDLALVGDTAYYASSKDYCLAGQKIAVTVADWESTASQCAAIATHVPASSRVRSCDCSYEKKPFSTRYAALCSYAYKEACFDIMMPPDSDCCDTETCYSKMELFDNDLGIQHEMKRRAECDDDIPGNCYNVDGAASDISQTGSTDCCTQTCSTCGSELAPGAVWESCTSNDPDTMTATCGRLSRYAQQDFVCDFSKCPTDSHWGAGKTSIYKYMGIGPEAVDLVASDSDYADVQSTDEADNSAKTVSFGATTLISFFVIFAFLFDYK